MVRVWIVTGLLAAAVVAGILVLTKEDEKAHTPNNRPPPPSALSEQEVRTYIAVWPELNQTMQMLAIEYQKERQRTGGKVDEDAWRQRSQAMIDAVFAKHNMTRAAWERVSNRVEYAVEVLRWEADAEERNKALDSRILEKKGLLEMTEGRAKKVLEQDIAKLEQQRTAPPPALLAQDKELIQSFWSDLAPIVPRRGPPPKKQ